MLDWVPYTVASAVLVAVQAALVALPGAGLPAWARPLVGRWWSLVLPLSIAVVIALLAVLPGAAKALTWLALLAIPVLAAATLGWAARGARAGLAVLAVPALVMAIADQGARGGQIGALVLTASSCVCLGRLLAGAAPTPWLRAAVVAMAVVDAVLVFSSTLEAPNAVLEAAAPGLGLPRLQYLALGNASLGYGDVFVAGVLGGILAAEGASARRRLAAAGVLLVASLLFDLLFAVPGIRLLPATVPVAAVTLLFGGLRGTVRPRARRPRPASPPGSPPPGTSTTPGPG